MNTSARSFSQTSRKYKLKLFGNYAHIEFTLTKEERTFLIEMASAHNFDVIWGSWVPQKGNVRKVGASLQLDPEKLRFVKT